jgi:hypothetical protein
MPHSPSFALLKVFIWDEGDFVLLGVLVKFAIT